MPLCFSTLQNFLEMRQTSDVTSHQERELGASRGMVRRGASTTQLSVNSSASVGVRRPLIGAGDGLQHSELCLSVLSSSGKAPPLAPTVQPGSKQRYEAL